MSLSETIFERAREHASREALSVRDRSISYAQLNQRALKLAAALVESGARRETIGLVGQRKAASYFGILGILYAGCSYTPINPKYSESRIAEILRNANIRFLVGGTEDIEKIAPILAAKSECVVQAILIPDGQAPAGSDWIDETALGRITGLHYPVPIEQDGLAYILFTSGSTGKPKGVQVLHRNVVAFLRSMSAIYPLPPGFRASQTFDLSFDPSASDMFFTWSRGGVLCVLPEEDQLLPSDYIRRERITFWNSVPTIAAFMNRMGALSPGSFPELRYSMFCGEQFPKHVADAWRRAAPNSTIENLYGPTEATIYITRHLYSQDQTKRQFKNSVIPIGRPFLDHEIALLDEAGKRVPNGAVGEIAFKGPQITKGYLNDPEKTDSVFVTFSWDAGAGKWYKTGDLGFINEQGDVECLGRKDNQVKLAGRRVELGDIETTLAQYPATRDAVVVALKDANQVVTALVAFTTHPLTEKDERFIRADSVKYIESIFFPKKILSIREFPVSPSGKIDRKALAILAQQHVSVESDVSS